MNNLETNIINARKICNGCYVDIPFHKIYAFTSESISGYINHFNLKDKSLLTVGSSGDQAINAFIKGSNNITILDINPFVKYYLNLKLSAISSLSYNEFLSFLMKYTTTFEYNKEFLSKDIFIKIMNKLKTLDYESYIFFNELINNFNSKEICNNLFDFDFNNLNIISNFNLYLKNEEEYVKLKRISSNFKFKYVNKDIIKDEIVEQYDNIFLSNLCTIVPLKTLKNLIIKLDNNLKVNGSMLLGYLWEIDYEDNKYESNWKDIYKMPLVKEELKEYIMDHPNIIGREDILNNSNKKSDLVLIYRKH